MSFLLRVAGGVFTYGAIARVGYHYNGPDSKRLSAYGWCKTAFIGGTLSLMAISATPVLIAVLPFAKITYDKEEVG